MSKNMTTKKATKKTKAKVRKKKAPAITRDLLKEVDRYAIHVADDCCDAAVVSQPESPELSPWWKFW